MKNKFALAAVLLFLLNRCLAQSDGHPAAPFSLPAYQAQLQAWSQTLETLREHPDQAAVIRNQVPSKSVVSNKGKEMEISHAWLKEALVDFIAAKPDRQPELLKQMQERLAAEHQQSALFAEPPSYPSGAPGKLDEILARREFRAVHGPTLWDKLRDRVTNWLYRLLGRIFRKVSYTPRGGQIVVWLAIAVGLCVVAIWLKRTAAQRIGEWIPREPVLFAPSAKHWKKWLAEAREAAQQGRWRDAVHLAYWAAISQLEQSGAWIPDRARTPREYLRLVPGTSQRRPVLEALTRQFEVIWYGQQTASGADFAAMSAELEKLGCR